jgi:CubicO group peptidase (beta-lactamase class C family)
VTERVWTPLGITTDDLIWRDLPTSNPTTADPRPAIPGNIPHRELASGIIANPNAMARLGLLYLRKGLWNNTRIIKEESAALASVPYAPIAALPVTKESDFPAASRNYGVLWWTNATKQLTDVPADAYWAWGLGDSLIVVIPSLEIVVARVGTGPDASPGPYWRSTPEIDPQTNQPTGNLIPVWNGKYDVLKDFLTPIAQSVTTP